MDRRFILAVFALCTLAVAVVAWAAERIATPMSRVETQVVAAIEKLRTQAGPEWRVKAGRADRVLSNNGSPADLAALAAEVEARGRGETIQQLASLYAARRDRYVAGLARLDGARARAFHDVAEGAPVGEVLARLEREIETVLAKLPMLE